MHGCINCHCHHLFFATHTHPISLSSHILCFDPVSCSSSTSAVVQKRKLIFHICFSAHIAVLNEISPLIILLALLLQWPYELPFSFINLFYFRLLRCLQLFVGLTPHKFNTRTTYKLYTFFIQKLLFKDFPFRFVFYPSKKFELQQLADFSFLIKTEYVCESQ